MRKISEIMKDLKDNYDELGTSYYPEDILEPDDTKVIYKEIERLKNGCEELEQQIDDLHKLETTITNENERLNNKIEELELDLQDTNSQLADVSKRCIKAIKYIEDMQKSPSYCDTWSTTAPHDIICILKGEDKN